ncbi:hypothetical protein LIA77_11447 [Sarocladium implicatum]|nr:hypothetical protein LIA77_11447 [Sarocladium implicatum]
MGSFCPERRACFWVTKTRTRRPRNPQMYRRHLQVTVNITHALSKWSIKWCIPNVSALFAWNSPVPNVISLPAASVNQKHTRLPTRRTLGRAASGSTAASLLAGAGHPPSL